MSTDKNESSSSSSSSSGPVIPPVPAGHTQLYVKNLAFATTEEALSAYVLTSVGVAPHSVNIVTTKRPGKFQGRSRGFGFVTIQNAAAKNTIDKLNGVVLEGRTLAVVEAKPRDPDAPRPRREPRPRRTRESNENNNHNNADNTNNTHDINAHDNNSHREPRERRQRPERKSFPEATQLYVNNLSFDTTEEELSAVFSAKTGQAPLDVDIVKSRFGKYEGRSRGFGFVFVANSVLTSALSLDGTVIAERNIGVQAAKTADHQDSGSSNNNDGDNNNGDRRRAPRRRGRRGGRGDGDRHDDSNNNHHDDNAHNSNNGGSTNDDVPDNRRRRQRGGGGGDERHHNEEGSSSRGRRPRRGRGGTGGPTNSGGNSN